MIYLSFIFVTLSAFVRYEGLLLIIPLLITYIIKNNQKNFSKKKLILGVLLFLMLIIPMNLINNDRGEIGIADQIIKRGNFISENVILNEIDPDDEFFATNENHTIIFIQNAIGGFLKYLGWILIPIFIIFCIIGIIFMPKKITRNKIIFGLFFIFLALSSIFAYGRGFQETRYLLVLLPIFALLSGYGFNYLMKYGFKKIILITVIGVIISSFIFTEYKSQDNQYEYEMYNAALLLTNDGSGVNHYNKDKYIKVADLQNNWPEILEKNEKQKMKMITKKFSVNEFTEPIEFIKFNENKGLTHLLIKEGENKGFFDEIFLNEANYEFLEKIYDSDGIIKYKIFRIDYEKLE